MAMNNKNTPSGKSLKMSADDLKEMVKAAVAECLGEEKEDTPPAEETAASGESDAQAVSGTTDAGSAQASADAAAEETEVSADLTDAGVWPVD